MGITSEEIRNEIDCADSSGKKEAILSYWMLSRAGDFWPGISKRMLGRKRLQTLAEIGVSMQQSVHPDVQLCGTYLVQVLQRIDEQEKAWQQEYDKLQIERTSLRKLVAEYNKKGLYVEATEAVNKLQEYAKRMNELEKQLQSQLE
jgi:hypothetical protein